MQELSETHHRPLAQKRVHSSLAISYLSVFFQVFFPQETSVIINFFALLCGCRNSYVVPTNLFQGIKGVNPMFRGYSQQVCFLKLICVKALGMHRY